MTKPDLEWARKHLTGFRKYEADVNHTKADERRYREQVGYMPFPDPELPRDALNGPA